MRPKYKIITEQNNKTKTDLRVLWDKIHRCQEAFGALKALKPYLSYNSAISNLGEHIKDVRYHIKHTPVLERKLAREVAGEWVSVPIDGKTDMKLLKKELDRAVNRKRVSLRAPKHDRKRFTYDQRNGNCVNYYTVGGVFLEPISKSILRNVKEAKTRISKAPDYTDAKEKNYLGIEIEFYCKANETEVVAAFAEANLHNHVYVKGDGSISPPDSEDSECIGSDCCDSCADGDCCGECNSSGYQGHEVNILCTQEERKDIIARVCAVLTKLGAEVNSSCGLHVHIDMRHRNANECLDRLVRGQTLLYAMVPQSRRNNHYCKPTPKMCKNVDYGIDRYHGINVDAYHKYYTLECRIHSGTVNATKITNWVDLLLQLTDTPYERLPGSLKGLQKKFSLSDTLTAYIKERLTQFAANREDIPFVTPQKRAVSGEAVTTSAETLGDGAAIFDEVAPIATEVLQSVAEELSETA